MYCIFTCTCIVRFFICLQIECIKQSGSNLEMVLMSINFLRVVFHQTDMERRKHFYFVACHFFQVVRLFFLGTVTGNCVAINLVNFYPLLPMKSQKNNFINCVHACIARKCYVLADNKLSSSSF